MQDVKEQVCAADGCTVKFRPAAKKVYCSKQCRKRSNAGYHESPYDTGLASSTVGKLSEMVVTRLFLEAGYYVYETCTANSPCDLIVMSQQTGKVLRVEVVSAFRKNKDGSLASVTKEDTYTFDVLARVCSDYSISFYGRDCKTPIDTAHVLLMLA